MKNDVSQSITRQMFSHVHFAWPYSRLRNCTLRCVTGSLASHLIRRVGTWNPSRLFRKTVVVVDIRIPLFIATKENIELVVFNSFFKLFESLTRSQEITSTLFRAQAHILSTTHSRPSVANQNSGEVLIFCRRLAFPQTFCFFIRGEVKGLIGYLLYLKNAKHILCMRRDG
jgi:hypothetical protein